MAAVLLALCMRSVSSSAAELISPGGNDAQRIDQLEQLVFELQHEIERLRSPEQVFQTVGTEDYGTDVAQASHHHPPVPSAPPSAPESDYLVTYDGGWVLRPRDPEQSPFELRFNIHNQFRYTGFDNEVRNFTDSAGVVRPIQSRNDFDINRGRFVFSGYAFDPDFEFYTNIDYNTVSTQPIQLLLSWFSYRVHEDLKVYAGFGKLPGTWEWEQSSRYTHGVERTLATTFFRPSITAGLWAVGDWGDNIHYRAMIADGFNTFTLRAAELDTNFAYSALVWWDRGKEFGVGFSDLENHQSPSVRFGHGFTFARNDSNAFGDPGPEQTVIRLSDGTRLVDANALAPGVTVNEFDISLYAVHAGLKYRGCSIAGEYLFRWLTSLEANGPLPDETLFDHGYFATTGVFLIPERLELYAVGSQVFGDFGDGSQVGGGINWYFGGERGNRLTFDVVRLEDSPAEQSRTGFVAGGTGTLFRLQWWQFF